MIIGVTGSSGAGKSTVCEILNKYYGAKTISADNIARALSKKGTNYLNEIVKEFGTEILLETGELDRKKLANIIYCNNEKRELLNKCTFKYIIEEVKKEIEASKEKIIAIDAPLLFEAKLDEICDVTVAVICEDRNIQIQRIIKRDKIDLQHALSRLNAQRENEFYISKSDYVLINNNSLGEQIKKLIFEIE